MFFVADDCRNLLDDTGITEDAEENQVGRSGAKEKDSPPGIVEKGIGQFPADQRQDAHYDRPPFFP